MANETKIVTTLVIIKVHNITATETVSFTMEHQTILVGMEIKIAVEIVEVTFIEAVEEIVIMTSRKTSTLAKIACVVQEEGVAVEHKVLAMEDIIKALNMEDRSNKVKVNQHHIVIQCKNLI